MNHQRNFFRYKKYGIEMIEVIKHRFNNNHICYFILGKKKSKSKSSRTSCTRSSDSSDNSISTACLEQLIMKLKCQRNRNSTKRIYHSVWRRFNQFFIRLNVKPDTWEDRLILFVGYLVENKMKSGTIKSYISAIKSVLLDDGIEINEDRYLIRSLTKACSYRNDTFRTRLPICKGFLNLILNKVVNIVASTWHYSRQRIMECLEYVKWQRVIIQF